MDRGRIRLGGRPLSNPDDEDERRRLSIFDLIGLAAGGVIGSGWLLSATKVWTDAGRNAMWAWVIGGCIMLLVAIVMVELSIAVPKTGGLIFLPLQSSGPLVATVVASALWLAYALNSATEAAAMTKGLGSLGVRDLIPSQQFNVDELTATGLVYATLFMVVILAVNLLARRLFIRFNSLLTLWKILIPVLIIVLLLRTGYHAQARACDSGVGTGFAPVLTAVTSSGVIFAYTGFQLPLDFAGNVRRRGMGEAARLRLAVYGTLVGAIILYVLLQFALLHVVRSGFCWDARSAESPYAQFAVALSFAWIAPLINTDALLSPMGSGLVYTHALTREVAALSRAHLTHRGLQTAKRASIQVGGQRIDVYWAVLLVDFAIGLIALVAVGGNWGKLAPANSILNMLLYAMPGVVLVAIHDRLPARWQGRRGWHGVLARLGFVSIALLIYWATWTSLWQSMTALIIGIAVLLGLPILVRQDLPVLGRALRRYDAKEYATLFRRYRENPAARAAITLVAYLAVLTVLGWSRNALDPNPHLVREIPLNILVVATSLVAFQLLVAFSRRHMAQFPPTLAMAPSKPVATTAATG